MAAEVDYYKPLKTSHKNLCLDTLERFMKGCLRWSYIVMKSTTRFPSSLPLLNIGYKYNSRKVLGFITTEGDGSTKPGDPYLSH